MPDIVATVISPEQLNPRGDAPVIAIERFAKRLLAQGDSWFSIGGIPPWATTSLLSQMVFSQSACIVNCAMPGKELAHMFDTTRQRRFLQLLRGRLASRWDMIMLSGGGNDLIDAALSPPDAPRATRLLLVNNEWDPAAPVATRYLSVEGWATLTAHIEAVFDQFLAERAKGPSQAAPVVLHGYDAAVPRDAGAGLGFGPWLHKAFDSYGLPTEHRVEAARALLVALRDLLAATIVARPGCNMWLVDTIGTLAPAQQDRSGESGDWENEIHPTPHGYSLLAQRWRPMVEAHW